MLLIVERVVRVLRVAEFVLVALNHVEVVITVVEEGVTVAMEVVPMVVPVVKVDVKVLVRLVFGVAIVLVVVATVITNVAKLVVVVVVVEIVILQLHATEAVPKLVAVALVIVSEEDVLAVVLVPPHRSELYND